MSKEGKITKDDLIDKDAMKVYNDYAKLLKRIVKLQNKVYKNTNCINVNDLYFGLVLENDQFKEYLSTETLKDFYKDKEVVKLKNTKEVRESEYKNHNMNRFEKQVEKGRIMICGYGFNQEESEKALKYLSDMYLKNIQIINQRTNR